MKKTTILWGIYMDYEDALAWDNQQSVLPAGDYLSNVGTNNCFDGQSIIITC